MQLNFRAEGGGGTLAGLFVVVLGILFLCGAAWAAKNTYELVTQGLRAQGTVTDVIETLETEQRKGQGSVTIKKFRYMVKFQDSIGHDVEFKDSIVDSQANHKKGDSVTVIYLQRDSADTATIDYGALNWLVTACLGFFGVVLTACGGLLLKGPRR
jgi:cytochrome c oxidase assembly protein Cox11